MNLKTTFMSIISKAKLRKQFLETRKNLNLKDINKCSQSITAKLLELIAISSLMNLHLYLPLRTEVDTSELINHLKQIGFKSVYFSKKEGSTIRKFKLKFNKSGIIQKIIINRFPPLQLILVPGVAFDLNKNRIGHGGGYYDRFLSRRKSAIKVGLAYDWQIVDKLPTEKHDIEMDYIITEKRVIE